MNLRPLFFTVTLGVLTLAPSRALADSDLVQFGSDIVVSAGHPVRDAVCFFCSVRAEGDVNGDIVVFFGGVYLDGKAHRDVVNFFGATRLADNSSVDRDLVNFFGSVRAGEDVKIGGSLVVILGTLRAPPSLSTGKDRFVQPPWLLWIPLCIFALIVFVIVHEFRSRRLRRMYFGYPVPPHP